MSLAEFVDHVIGVDPDRDRITAAVVCSKTQGEIASKAFATTVRDYGQVMRWAKTYTADDRRVWSIESTGSYGAGLAAALTARGEFVVEFDHPSTRPSKDGAKSEPSPPSSPPSAEPDPTVEPSASAAPSRDGSGPRMNLPGERHDPENSSASGPVIGSSKSTSSLPPSSTASTTPSAPATRTDSARAGESKKKEEEGPGLVSDRVRSILDINNYKNDADKKGCVPGEDAGCEAGPGRGGSMCIGKVGFGCRTYRYETEYIKTDRNVDYSKLAASCGSNVAMQTFCDPTLTKEYSVTVETKWGMSEGPIKAEIGISQSEKTSVQINCGNPRNPELYSRIDVYPAKVVPKYSLAMFHSDNNDLIERSGPHYGSETVSHVCNYVPK